MIAVFSAYREPSGVWASRLLAASALARQMNAGEPYAPIGDHTRHEAEMMVAECQRLHEVELLAITSPNHNLRANLTLLKVLIDQGLDRRIRFEVIEAPDAAETDKLERYQALGHVASPADMDAYRHWWNSCATS